MIKYDALISCRLSFVFKKRLSSKLQLQLPQLRTLMITGLPIQRDDYEIMDLEGFLKEQFQEFDVESSNIGMHAPLVCIVY